MQIFIANIDSISKNPNDFMAMLSPADFAHAMKFKNKVRKLQFVLGHFMVDKIGRKHTSIAHKDKFVIVATAENMPVGVDIENTSVKRDFVEIAETMNFKTPKSLQDFYKHFTEYEATYKLGVKSACTHFITYGDYLICIVSNHQFAKPHLKTFNAELFLTPKKEQ